MTDNEKEKEILTPQQELFCQYYTQNDELKGNATLAYAEAFDFPLDEQSKDDAQYRFDDGIVYAYFEIKDREKSDKYHYLKGEKIQESSFTQMYNNVSTYASKLRKRMYIQKRCRELLNEFLVDYVIDARLMDIILNGDANESMKAIQEYNKLKQRIVDRKDITSDGKPLNITFDPIFDATPRETTENNS